MSGEPQNTTPISTPTTPPPKTEPAETKPPGPLSKPWEFIEHQIAKNAQHLKAAWLAVLIITCGVGYLGYLLRGHLDQETLTAKDATITAKDATITSKEATIQFETSRANGLQAEHDKLFKENTDLKTANAELTSPLKKRVLTLSTQLKEFAETCTNRIYVMAYSRAFDDRFAQRIFKATSQLDEEGQHSELIGPAFDYVRYSGTDLSNNSNSIMTVSKELERLANRLKD